MVSGTEDREPVATVRRARRRDVATLADILAGAFEHDPFYGWMLAGTAGGRAIRRSLFAAFLRAHLRDGLVLTTGDLVAAALWTTPARPYGGLITRLTLPSRMRALLGARAEVVRREVARLNAARPPAPHWYLVALGVLPERQGRGIGTALLRPVLDDCDRTVHEAYLETSLEANLPLYLRLGFEVVVRTELETGPAVWGLLRAPRGTGA